MSKIYRFMTFESLIDTFYRQNLTFVHPSLWEDPYELSLFKSNFENTIKNTQSIKDAEFFGIILEKIVSKNVYCQSWTKVKESDAMWRIYNHNDTSVRIQIDTKNISKLKNVELLNVKYVEEFDELLSKKNSFHDALRIKRKAFSHEKEVRLLTHLKVPANEVDSYILDYLTLTGKSQLFKNIDMNDIPNEVDRILKKLNITLIKKTKKVSFEKIENFIENVMLSPFAPEWVNETLDILCKEFNVNYLGKSKLYLK